MMIEPSGPASSLIPDEVMMEFDVLRTALDLRCINRPEWDRLKTIIVTATLLAYDSDSGAAALVNTTAMWRESAGYDGAD
jgi:hypothetical protein